MTKITIDRAVVEQTLDVIELPITFGEIKREKTIAALRAALAEPPTNQCAETCERAKLCAVCARELEEPTVPSDCAADSHQQATELRRLHAELERCKQVCAATAEGWRVERDALLEALKKIAAIKAAEGEAK